MKDFQENLMKEKLPWIEKYRPETIDDVCSQADIIKTIKRFLSEKKLPHLLFYGPPGTGKTSTVLALSKFMYGSKYKSMILELNASDERGIEIVREKIKTFASTKTIFNSGVKLIILDEADSMTNIAQAALRRVIEKYTKNVRFCIICNYLSKIIPAIQSRCTSFRFQPLKSELVESRLNFVIESEGLSLTNEAKEALFRIAKGDMRKILNILQASSMTHHVVQETTIYNCTGLPLPKDIANIIHWILNDPFIVANKKIRDLKVSKSLSTVDIISELHLYSNRIELPPSSRIILLDDLATIEYRLALGACENIQLTALLCAFVKLRDVLSS